MKIKFCNKVIRILNVLLEEEGSIHEVAQWDRRKSLMFGKS